MEDKTILEFIEEKEKEGKAAFYVHGNLATMDIDDLINQPVEGLLWDLNRDEVTCSFWIDEGELGWVNNYATQLVIKKLYEKIFELEKEAESLQEQSTTLSALEQAGVDNWTGYGYAMELREDF